MGVRTARPPRFPPCGDAGLSSLTIEVPTHQTRDGLGPGLVPEIKARRAIGMQPGVQKGSACHHPRCRLGSRASRVSVAQRLVRRETLRDRRLSDETLRRAPRTCRNLPKAPRSSPGNRRTVPWLRRRAPGSSRTFREVAGRLRNVAGVLRNVAGVVRDIAGDLRDVARGPQNVAGDVRDVAGVFRSVAGGFRNVSTALRKGLSWDTGGRV